MRFTYCLVLGGLAAMASLAIGLRNQPPESGLGVAVPSWAKVAPEQIAEAKKHGVPVAFENDLGMRFVLIPAGTFWMGSQEGEEGRAGNETRHRVTLTRQYCMQTTEVTNAEYRRWKQDHDSGVFEGHSLNGANQPVVEVSWNDAVAYAKWLSGRDGKRTYRLPTEAEWEHACRAGTQTRYSWGEAEAQAYRYANGNDPKTKAEFGWSWDAFPKDDGYRVTAPVGHYRPNGWGLFDLHGNVWEWCQDWSGEYPEGRVTDPTGAASGDSRVLRGGSWNFSAGSLRSSNRGRFPPGFPRHYNGFRVVVSLPR